MITHVTILGSSYIKKEVLFDEEDGGKGIIDHYVFNEKKKAVCRVHGT